MRRSTTKTIILAVLLGFIAAAAGVGVRLYTAWNSKGETLIDAAKKSAENSASYDALESQGKFNILLMGEDNVDGSRRSDTILFITVDIDDKNIRVLSLPRDTRVMIPGHGTQKLNHAFAYGGQDLMRATVTNYLGEPILYYMIVDYDSFPAFVDMLGGVEIDVPKRMRYVDRAGGLDINIQPGLQTLDGKTALHFVRFRKDALGDIGRIQRQQQFLKAMLKKAYDPRVIIPSGACGPGYEDIPDGYVHLLRASARGVHTERSGARQDALFDAARNARDNRRPQLLDGRRARREALPQRAV